MIKPEYRFKFVGDFTALEIKNLLCTHVSSYDFYSHVPSDIPTHHGYIQSEKLESQKNLELINEWTEKKKMELNYKKTKNMIFNFTKNHQFTTRINVNNNNIEVVKDFKILVTIITDDLKWEKIHLTCPKKHGRECNC